MRCRIAISPPKLLLDNLPPGQDIFYRVRFDDIADAASPARRASGISVPRRADRHSVSFLWSGDTAGQGWGIDPARGGMRTYRTMLQNRPDFFIHSGDHIYADCPVQAELKLPNGEIWRNLVTEEKSAVAHSLAQFRGNYKYNLLDENVRAFHAEVPMFAQWDDHEVTNDWSPIGAMTRPATTRTAARAWWRAPAAPSSNSCRSARPPRRPGGSIAGLPTARCSTSS